MHQNEIVTLKSSTLGEVRVASRGQEIVSVPSQGVCFTCISCVPRSRNCICSVPGCPLHVYQLRPELSNPNMTSCVPQLVRNCISCIERYGCTKCPTIGMFLHSFIVLYFVHNYIHTYRIVE